MSNIPAPVFLLQASVSISEAPETREEVREVVPWAADSTTSCFACILIRETRGQPVCCKNASKIQRKTILGIEALWPMTPSNPYWSAGLLPFSCFVTSQETSWEPWRSYWCLSRGRWRSRFCSQNGSSILLLSASAGVFSAQQPRFLQSPEKHELRCWRWAPV